MDKKVFKVIEEKPGVFFKRLIPFWHYQLTYSKTFMQWVKDEEAWRVDEIKEYSKDIPRVSGEVANIVRCLEERYNDSKYDYQDYTYVSLAIKLHKKYRDRIIKYFYKKHGGASKWAMDYIPSREDAWKEFVQRGFVPEFFNIHDKDKYYLRSNIGNMVLVKNAKKTSEAQQEQMDYGIMGFTGYNEPK